MKKIYLSLLASTLLCFSASPLDRQYNTNPNVVSWAKILGATLDPSAPFAENVNSLNRAFKKKSLTCHPDKTNGDPELEALFKTITGINDKLEIMFEHYQKIANPDAQQETAENFDANFFVSTATAGIDSTMVEARKLSTKLPINIQIAFMQMGYCVLKHIKEGTFNPKKHNYYEAMTKQKDFPKFDGLLYSSTGAAIDPSLLLRSTAVGEPAPTEIKVQQSYLMAVVSVSWALEHMSSDTSSPTKIESNALTLVSSTENLNQFFMGYGALASRMSGTLGRKSSNTSKGLTFELDMRFLRNQGYLQILPHDCTYMEVSADRTPDSFCTALHLQTIGGGSITASVASSIGALFTRTTEAKERQDKRMNALTEFYKAVTNQPPKKSGARYMYADLLELDEKSANTDEKTAHAETFWGMALALFPDHLLPYRLGFEKVIRLQD
ncbi:MAG TPA: hypothetical protein DIC42_01465 [Holosporales bacterium]|nr:hypothetical protein [Holosporales bacterium]